MYLTGLDMQSRYKETSLAGLALKSSSAEKKSIAFAVADWIRASIFVCALLRKMRFAY